MSLKGVWHKILGFFMNQFPRTPEYPIGFISNFYKYSRGDISNFVFIVGVGDTGD